MNEKEKNPLSCTAEYCCMFHCDLVEMLTGELLWWKVNVMRLPDGNNVLDIAVYYNN